MPEGTTWTVPDGGFFIWVTMPEGLDATAMRPMLRELGVDFLPGATCFSDGKGKNQFRLCYSFVTDDRIDEGIRILGDVIKSEIKETGRA
jgi:DNA-binding transcriptional MocR family regulator